MTGGALRRNGGRLLSDAPDYSNNRISPVPGAGKSADGMHGSLGQHRPLRVAAVLDRRTEVVDDPGKELPAAVARVAVAVVSANTVLHYGKDGTLTGPDEEHVETSMLALHLIQSALVHINTLLIQQVLAEPAWASRLSDEDRRGLTALFWSNVNPYGTFRLDMGARLDLGPVAAVPRPRASADAADRSRTQPR
ncbi:Tn3 family transposase [Streptomyces griseoloalbus]|uniref:Tn3 family transposase n=1 Tax=Streptomyces griseoloalbus TaxID=67303 RepID=UPI00296EED9C